MKKKRSAGILLAGALVMALVFVWNTDFTAAKEKTNDVIPDNVYIGEVAVGGMTSAEAKEAVEDYVKENKDGDVVLTAGENSVTVKTSDLGLTWGNTQVVDEAVGIGKSGNLIKRYKDKKDLENQNKVYDIVYTVDTQKVTEVLNEQALKLDQKAVNASLTRENGDFVYTDGKQGISVNVDDSVKEIREYFNSGWDGADATIALVADVVEPEGNKESLAKVKDVLGTYHTNFSDSSASRITNIKNAVSKIDGTVLYPGEEFSVYAAIAPLDAGNGYELAGAYENGTTVQSYGGGVCQVSTTLYNAVLYSELDVTQRSNHSMMVHYVDPSRDAAIAGTYKDLKFKNSSEAPIYLEGYTNGSDLYFTVYGEETRPQNRKVEYQSETVSQDTPPVQIVAAAAPIGYVATTQSPHVGQSAQLWKIVTVDGVEQSREVVNTSKYASTPKVIAVGNVGNDPNACAAINAAIATQDEATVRAAAAQYAGSGTTPDQAAEQPAADQTPAADAAAPAETTPAADAAATTDAAAATDAAVAQ